MSKLELPDNWAIQGGKELAKYFRDTGIVGVIGRNTDQYYFPIEDNNRWTARTEPQFRTVITLDQYKESLNSSKPIVGYKLIKPGFIEAINIITSGCITQYSRPINTDRIFPVEKYPRGLRLLEEAGVLDLWFEPVYEIEKEIELPIIGNAKGEVRGAFLVYGCQRVHISLFNTAACNLKELNVHGHVVREDLIDKIRTYLYENNYLKKSDTLSHFL